MPKVTFYLPDSEIKKLIKWQEESVDMVNTPTQVGFYIQKRKDKPLLAFTFKCEDVEIH